MRVFLLLAGWALFGLSLALPAITVGGFMLNGTYEGWVCLLVSVPCVAGFASGEPKGVYVGLVGLSNLLMLASPALALWGARWATGLRLAFLAAFILACAFRLVSSDDPGAGYHVGYYFWCASFAAVAAALHFE